MLTWSGYGILSNVVCLVIAGILLWWIVLVVNVAPPGVGCVKKINALQRVDIYISLVNVNVIKCAEVNIILHGEDVTIIL